MPPTPEAVRRADTAPPRRAHWRYRIVVGLIVLAIVGAAAAGWWYARSSTPAFGPVIIVTIDSVRADHLPAYGYAKVKTPALDALAADGIVFERAFAHSPLTLPSHVSILSGQLPFQTGVRDDVGFTLPSNVALLPQLLRRRGFKTGGVVSTFLLRRDTGLGQAFGFFDDEFSRTATDAPAPVVRDGIESVKVAERWVDLIKTQRFFLFLQINGPQAPYTPPQRFARYRGYDGEIAHADESLGRLIQFLKDRDLYDPAVIVVLSDHGEELGDHGEQEHGLFLYDSTIHTPLIVKMPTQAGAGRRSNVLVQHVDLVPTILDMMGAPRAPSVRGRSVRHVLDSADATMPDREVYAESWYGRFHFGWSELTSLSSGRYRYVKAPRPELYDMLQDRNDQRNIIESQVAAASSLRAALDRLLAAGQAPPQEAPGPARSMPEPEVLRRIESLGTITITADVAADVPSEQLPDPKDRRGVVEKYREALRLEARGDMARAISAWREVVRIDPGAGQAWERLGTLLVTEGQFADAGVALERFTRQAPDAGRAQTAEALVRDLLKESPTADRYALAIRVWLASGDRDEAADLRTRGRKAVGVAALRRAEAIQKPAK
ncbi:MAG TPA: sulfatase-like hydrolase/transferase [Vicinamibacterales bacterium]